MDYRKIGSFLALTAVLAVLMLVTPVSPSPADAQVGPQPVTGWAWSSNIGWIKFDHDHTPVLIDENGNFAGYAWSSNIGWIDFSPSGPYPVPGADHGARLETDGRITGWARALNGANQSDANWSGWDGWIRFDHGRDNPVTVDLTTGRVDGFAWGGTVIGWIDMSPLVFDRDGDGDDDPPPDSCENTNSCSDPTPSCDPTIRVCNGGGGGDDGFNVTIKIIGDGKVHKDNTSGAILCETSDSDGDLLNNADADADADADGGCIVNFDILTVLFGNPDNTADSTTWTVCQSASGDTCTVSTEENVTVLFGDTTVSDDPFDVETCRNLFDQRTICTLRINCEVSRSECQALDDENIPVYSNAVKLINKLELSGDISWQADPLAIQNGSAGLEIVFCSDRNNENACSISPQTLPGDAFIRARLTSRGNETTVDVSVTGTSLSDTDKTDTETVRVQYKDGGTSQ